MSAARAWDQMTTQERDALVAEKVMRLRHRHMADTEWLWLSERVFYGSTTDIARAWEVVEKLGEQFAVTIESDGAGRWDAAFWAGDEDYNAWSSSAPEAICLAALRAVGVEI